MLIAISQIKLFHNLDIELFCKWYIQFIKCDKLILVNDESSIDLNSIPYIKYNKQIKNYNRTELNFNNTKYGDFNNQTKIYNCIIDKENCVKGDIILTPDADEFWWYDYSTYTSFKECINNYHNKMHADSIVVPWINMSSNEVLKNRNDNYFNTFHFRTTNPESEHKPILFYKGFMNTSHHNGYTNYKSITKIGSKYFTSLTHFSAPLRIYHFRWTTLSEYENKKICVNTHEKRTNLNHDLATFIQYGHYNVIDNTLINTYMKFLI